MLTLKRSLSAARYIAESVLPLLFWVILIFGFDTPDIAILTILAALIHELGHLLAASLTKRGGVLRSHLSGFRIGVTMGSYTDQIILLAAGPLVNLAVFLLTLPHSGLANGYFLMIGYINLLSALSNLLPIEGYDGYGILMTLAEAKNSHRAFRLLCIASFTLTLSLTLISLYIMLRYGGGYWIFGVFFVTLLTKIKKLL